MRTIYKYRINFGAPSLEIPLGSKCIHVGSQGEHVCMWVEVDDDAQLETERWHLFIIGTGHQLPAGAEHEHLGSVIMDPFVWHLYRVMP